MLNRILVIVATVLAVAAVVLSVMLANRRNEFRDRADKLAATLAEISKTLDQDAGTGLSKNISFTAADPVTGTPEKGSLGWQEFHKSAAAKDDSYQKTLKAATELAKATAAQRKLLAEKLAETTVNLGAGDEVAAADLLSNDKYKDAAGRAPGLATAVKNRDDAMIKAVVAASTTIGHPVEEKAFRDRQQTVDAAGNNVKGEFNHTVALTDFSTNVTGLNQRSGDYAEALTQVVDHINKFSWTTDKAKIKSEKEYSGALTSLLNDADDINGKIKELDIVKVQLEERIKELKAVTEDRDSARKDLTKANQMLTDINTELDKFKSLLSVKGKGLSPDMAKRNISGKVLQVNRDYNFVILNLGTDDVAENMEFIVRRDDKCIGRLVVSKVFPTISIAEILPHSSGKIKADDKVIRPMQVEVAK